MEALLSLPALVLMALLGVSSVKVTSGGQSRLVERLGKYDRQLQPGLSLVLPVLEKDKISIHITHWQDKKLHLII